MLAKMWILFYASLIATSTVSAQNVTDARNLLTDLLTDHDHRIRPVINQSIAVEVEVGMTLLAVNEINDVQEVMRTTSFLSVYWIDETLQWDPSAYGNITSIFLPQNDVWKPDITLKNSFENFKEMGLKTLNVKINNYGYVEWHPFQKFESSCSIDVRHFPFDEQTCEFELAAWSYRIEEVSFIVSTFEMDQFEESATWTIVDSMTEISDIHHEPTAFFRLHLKRKPLYTILSVILPIILLSVLDLFVFLLPCSCGEKNSYAVTVFLAFAVFLTLVEASMPKNSESIALFSVYLIILTFNSTLITFSSIAMTKVLSFENLVVPKVFVWMSKIGELKFCKKSKRKSRNKVGDQNLSLKEVSKDEENGKVTMNVNRSEITPDEGENQAPTWESIMNGLELFLLYAFSLELILVSLVFILGIHYGTL